MLINELYQGQKVAFIVFRLGQACTSLAQLKDNILSLSLYGQ